MHHVVVSVPVAVLAHLHTFGDDLCLRRQARRLVIFPLPLCLGHKCSHNCTDDKDKYNQKQQRKQPAHKIKANPKAHVYTVLSLFPVFHSHFLDEVYRKRFRIASTR